MYCTNCGEKIADGATFCSKCGTKVITEQIASAKATQKTEEEIYANRPHKGPQSTSYTTNSRQVENKVVNNPTQPTYKERVCTKCGTRYYDNRKCCPNCFADVGLSVDAKYAGTVHSYSAPAQQPVKTIGENKAGFGVLMALFLGFIGLIIGVCIYSSGTEERRTFIKGFWITYAVCLAVAAIILIIVFAGASCYLNRYY